MNMSDKLKGTEVTCGEYAIANNVKFVNKALDGKTIRQVYGADQSRVFIEFWDGSTTMIEILESEKGEKFLAVLCLQGLK